MYFDLSWLSYVLSPEISWKIFHRLWLALKGHPIASWRGSQVFIWGSNRFVGSPNILSVDDKPSITVDSIGNRLYLTADFFDRDGRLVMKVRRNRITLNQNNIFKIEEWKRDKLKIINQYGEPIEIISHRTGEIELNGIFYVGKNRFDSSKNGLVIN